MRLEKGIPIAIFDHWRVVLQMFALPMSHDKFASTSPAQATAATKSHDSLRVVNYHWGQIWSKFTINPQKIVSFPIVVIIQIHNYHKGKSPENCEWSLLWWFTLVSFKTFRLGSHLRQPLHGSKPLRSIRPSKGTRAPGKDFIVKNGTCWKSRKYKSLQHVVRILENQKDDYVPFSQREILGIDHDQWWVIWSRSPSWAPLSNVLTSCGWENLPSPLRHGELLGGAKKGARGWRVDGTERFSMVASPTYLVETMAYCHVKVGLTV